MSSQRQVSVAELKRAWRAVQDGTFQNQHPQAYAAEPGLTGSLRSAGARGISVLGCGGAIGATTTALALALALDAPCRLIEGAPPAASGLAGASTAELGERVSGWTHGTREQVLIERAIEPVGPTLPRSRPVELNIPSIGVRSTLMTLGTNPAGSVQVPPLSGGASPGWYRGSPTPGQLGPAVILGHVHDDAGPAVFYDLSGLKPGARVSITRADHRVAVFRVERVDSYPKDQFPTTQVYGNTDRAELRLITCGTWNPDTRTYERNIVVYAALVAAHPE